MFKNEKKTENIARNILRDLKYYDIESELTIEEQNSEIDSVRQLMKNASKSGGAGRGSPEFIISSAKSPDFILIVECKASLKDHHSNFVKSILNGETIKESEDICC